MKIGRLKDEATKDTAVGYCFLRKHEGNINKKQLKRHRCIEKECPYFIKYSGCKVKKIKEILEADDSTES